MTEHSCNTCGQPIPRKADEPTCYWLRRKHCSDACRGQVTADRNRAKAKPPERPETPPPCVICGAPIQRKPRDSVRRWLERKVCGSAHAAEYAQRLAKAQADRFVALRPIRECAVCSKPIPTGLPRTRKTCSDACAKRAMVSVMQARGREALAKLPPPPTKNCDACGAEFKWRVNEKRSVFEKRRACSVACAAKLRATSCSAAKRASRSEPREASKVAALIGGMGDLVRHRIAWQQATADERRLFAPELRRVFEAGA